MSITKVTTAAFLAGVTTLAVSLPAFANAAKFDHQKFDKADLSKSLAISPEISQDKSGDA